MLNKKIMGKELRSFGRYDDTTILRAAELKSPKLREIKENWL